MPSLLEYPSQCVEVVAKHIFSIFIESRAHGYGCTKADAIQIKKYWGYIIKINRGRTIEVLSEASKVPLEHMFNNNENISVEW